MLPSNSQSHRTSKMILTIRALQWAARHWLLLFSLGYGLFVALPFAAPVFMSMGWVSAGKIIYFLYSFLCHQLPQRSLFLFGPKGMYTLGEIQAAWQDTLNPMLLRQYTGSAVMGWKVAWSDRMISMYTSILIGAWIWYPLRRKLSPLPLLGLVLFMVPMGIDGVTHMISDFAGFGQGFRDSNAWLAALTNHQLAFSFYAGDALGSFNSWMRWVTGILFGLGVAWFAFPLVEEVFGDAGDKPTQRSSPLPEMVAQGKQPFE